MQLRVAYSPSEFGTLFGKSETWGYRQIYAGKVKAITEHGRILIPADEVEKILKKAGIYNGMEKSKPAPARAGKLTREHQSIWWRSLKMRRQIPGAPVSRGRRRNSSTCPPLKKHFPAVMERRDKIASAWKHGRKPNPE